MLSVRTRRHRVTGTWWRRPTIVLALTIMVVALLSGCSLVPASWKVAFGSQIEVLSLIHI